MTKADNAPDGLCSPEHPQWKRRRKWTTAGSTTGLAMFVAAGVGGLVNGITDGHVSMMYAAAGLFLVSSGIYASVALIRNRLGGRP